MIAVSAENIAPALIQEYLVRLGLYGETLRCLGYAEPPLGRNATVIVKLERGEMLATILQQLPASSLNAEALAEERQGYVWIDRVATAADLQEADRLQQQSRQDFVEWKSRLEQWRVNVELVDLEWTLDGKRLMLYVLNDRGAETTKLALQAAAAGFGYLDVLPVTAAGLSPGQSSSGGGGGCGCGSGGGGCHK